MGHMSRDKGKRGEREVIALLQPLVTQMYEAHGLEPVELKRNTLQSDGGGDDIVGLPWASIEVKYVEQDSLEKWWEQCLRQAGADKVPILLYRRNKVSWMARLIGYVGEPSCGHTVPVIVTLPVFLTWLRTELHRRLSDGQ